MPDARTSPSRWPSKFANQKATIEQLGFANWCRMKLLPAVSKRLGGPLGRVNLPGFPLYFRKDSSDRYVLHQIFIEREYSCFDDLESPGLILDCGANVGYSSAYFLSRFPTCTVVAVEPDPDNFAMLERNLQPFGDRAKAIRAAVWSHPARLKFSDAPYRDGLDWSNQVIECGPDEPASVPAVDIGTLLQDSGADRIALLKMDIEGAEAVVFSRNFDHWIGRVDNIAIEIHDDTLYGKASGIFEAATEGLGFEKGRSGELTIRKQPSSKAAETGRTASEPANGLRDGR